ncbi:murein biosynthesis integral membrane protein MurJ [Nostoc sp. RF31YmG]|nr:murein biosynthesis integral membrane protein MurJ [Nostoc sp. RF31YmG]
MLRRASSFGGLTLLSRCTGVLRDAAIASAFGAGAASDAFVLAFRIPNALRRLFAEGALSAAFVPLLVRETDAGPAALATLIARLAGTLAVVVMGVSALGILLATPLSLVFAPGVAGNSAEAARLVSLLRILFPFLACVSLAALAGAVLMSQGRFARWALAPGLLNLAMAAGAWAWAPHWQVPILALAWAVVIGGLLQLLWCWQGVAKLGLLRWPRWGGGDARVREAARRMLPTLAGASVAQVNLLFASAAASLLAAGSQTWLFQADRFLELPLALFGASMGVVLLPTLSREFAGQGERASDTLAWALRGVTLASLPATVGLVLLAEPLMLTFFQYGHYRAEDARMSANALACMSLGLPALAAIKVMLPACYARGDLALPVRAAGIALACNVGCALLLFAGARLLAAGNGELANWLARPGLHTLLALASAIANGANALLLWRGLRRAGVVQVHGAAWRAFARVALACVAMAMVVVPLRGLLDFHPAGIAQRVAMLVGLMAAGGAACAAAWYLAGGRLSRLRTVDG